MGRYHLLTREYLNPLPERPRRLRVQMCFRFLDREHCLDSRPVGFGKSLQYD